MDRKAERGLGWLTCLGLLALGAMTASPAGAATGTLIKRNCAPQAASANGTMIWVSKNARGLDNPYIGDSNCKGRPLLPPYDGQRGASDITKNGRYVLLTTAVGWDKTTVGAEPGKGSGNAIQLYDRRTHKLSTLLPGARSNQKGLIVPRFNANGTKIAWAEMVAAPEWVNFPWGDWELHVADVDLRRGRLSHDRAWRDPAGGYAMIEAYGWIPGTHRIIFQSTTRATSPGFQAAQLWTLPDNLNPRTAPTRITPKLIPRWSWQHPEDAFHEFAAFAPGHPFTLYTSIAADTVGGDDLFAYNLRTQARNGLLGQPRRISYLGGDPNRGYITQAVPGWPTPAYRVVTKMAWVHGSWLASVCSDIYCTKPVDAYRITLLSTAAVHLSIGASELRGAGARRQRHHAAGPGVRLG
ncbi:MAG: hypothetical protein ACXVSJ_02745 [Solirubrobacteraceae bacterium]